MKSRKAKRWQISNKAECKRMLVQLDSEAELIELRPVSWHSYFFALVIYILLGFILCGSLVEHIDIVAPIWGTLLLIALIPSVRRFFQQHPELITIGTHGVYVYLNKILYELPWNLLKSSDMYHAQSFFAVLGKIVSQENRCYLRVRLREDVVLSILSPRRFLIPLSNASSNLCGFVNSKIDSEYAKDIKHLQRSVVFENYDRRESFFKCLISGIILFLIVWDGWIEHLPGFTADRGHTLLIVAILFCVVPAFFKLIRRSHPILKFEEDCISTFSVEKREKVSIPYENLIRASLMSEQQDEASDLTAIIIEVEGIDSLVKIYFENIDPAPHLVVALINDIAFHKP